MPKKEIDYKKAMIYKICCNDLKVKDIYVGSTTEFTKRKNSHKSRCHKENNKCFNFNVYRSIRDNGGWDNWSMILIENYPCNNNNELKSRERYYIETLNAKLNMTIPNRTKQEQYQETKEQCAIKAKTYYVNNKEQIINRIRKNYENQKQHKSYCECGSIVLSRGMKKHLKIPLHKNLLSNPFINFKL